MQPFQNPTLKVLGNHTEFQRVASLLQDAIDFDTDVNASVFETNIRGTAVAGFTCNLITSWNQVLCVCVCSGGGAALCSPLGWSGRDGAGTWLALFRTAAPDG